MQQSCRRKSFAELTGARYIGHIPYRFSVSLLLDTLYAAISIHLYCRDIKNAAMYNLLDYILQESAIVEEQHTPHTPAGRRRYVLYRARETLAPSLSPRPRSLRCVLPPFLSFLI